jgi:uracil phosphoribosyltransferase
MPLTQFTDRHLVRLLATETRRTDTTPRALAASHVALGRFLAGELVEQLELEPCLIAHPQGQRSGWQIAAEAEICILSFMRAGLYAAEGVREVLQCAQLLHVHPSRGAGLSPKERDAVAALSPRTAVIVDSVVNTGASLEPVLGQLAGAVERVFVLALVTPVETAARLAADWPDVHFLFARTSTNQYVGAGATDTGNRLFGTTRRRE